MAKTCLKLSDFLDYANLEVIHLVFENVDEIDD